MQPVHRGVAGAACLSAAMLGAAACASRAKEAPAIGSDGGDDAVDEVPSFGMFGGDAGSVDEASASTSARGTLVAPDCAGCKFPDSNASPCPAGAPPLRVVYPTDGILLPPNMNTLSVQWTPFGGYSLYEVDFANSITDLRIIARCASETVDTAQPPTATGGCELVLTPAMWKTLATPNRGGSPVTVTVRGTTDGTCATTSQDSVHLSFAEEDLLGALFYWKSTISSNGTGGQIWVKGFGDTGGEQPVTGAAGGSLSSSCNGCHALSRDGLRMVVYSDDDDSDDEYGDVSGSLIDMPSRSKIGTTFQPPGFSTLAPSHTLYLTSTGRSGTQSNVLSLWSGDTGMLATSIPVGTVTTDRPTMPDWSPDGRSVVYVLPGKVGSTSYGGDDDHVFGGSLYTIPYMGMALFGSPSAFVVSKGENNYYPSYSPDGQFIVFDRALPDSVVTTLNGCTSTPHPACPNDSFSNPAARLMLIPASSAAPIDLENANGSAASAPHSLSNSWPRWSPFVQSYRGSRLLWLAFSSTRDYGLRVRNHKPGMYQCYPPDSPEVPSGSHGQAFDPLCQQPQLWMAAINLSELQGTDPSFPAFWLPFQDITTHNHTPQWTQQVVSKPPPRDAGACIKQGDACKSNPSGCCTSPVYLTCGGDGTCQPVLN